MGDDVTAPRGSVARLAVLVNAAAGSVDDATLDDQLDAIRAAFAAADPAVDVSVEAVDPEHLGEAMRSAWAAAPRPDAVVVAGGDGTVSGAAHEAAGTDLVLGVLPLGTFNHFAKDLGVPADLDRAAVALVSGQVRRVDVAEANGRTFVNNAVLGVYPQMVAIRDRIRDQRGWGKVRAVPVAAGRVLRSFPVHRLDLRGPGFVRRRVRTPLVFVGNGTYGGEDAAGRVARGDLEDGTLDVALARVATRRRLVATIVRALVSGADAARDLDRAALAEVTISARTRHLRVALDGEIVWMATPLRIRIRPHALHVLAPAPS